MSLDENDALRELRQLSRMGGGVQYVASEARALIRSYQFGRSGHAPKGRRRMYRTDAKDLVGSIG